ncbi:MAG: butyrate kinase [Bacteroidales bacterium]|jgi:butyrate kinase|nr:butyrate kinase [Bacteroidales bacterium]HOL97644.1 butyrate kinase [Bacteroidales bacterium]HOM37070.1 butyrate kinase [Bacteroidales bacterium]HPD24380.1 butyrate kinase [Bacteroidales bacterium]HRT00254.1 butyrate kinase [Bacteroidales bacterium]
MRKFRILAINPGSTSTKIAIFENETKVFQKNIKHSTEDLAPFASIADQYEFRKNAILEELKNAGEDFSTIDCIMGRGGLINPIPSGVYEINKKMKNDLRNSPIGEHASNLGGLIADDLAKELNGVKAYIADPVVVDEMEDIARIAGHPLFERISIFHALNQKAIARRCANDMNARYEDLNFIIAHLGGGISVGAHHKGRVVDVNNALNGEGPFSPERSGTLPAGQLVKICFSGKYSLKEINLMLKGNGGFAAYLGTNDAYEVEMRAKNGDEKAQFISNAMAYQVAKEIGALSAVLKGKVDAIILTGGIAYNKQFCSFIEEMVGFIAPLKVYPGEDEMFALAMNGLLVLRGEIEPKVY